jgi:hypothetical protein
VGSNPPYTPRPPSPPRAGGGGGGGWLQPSLHTPQPIPVHWRTTFDTDIQSQLITATNPTGTITNSNLELAAIITGTSLANHHLFSSPQITYQPLHGVRKALLLAQHWLLFCSIILPTPPILLHSLSNLCTFLVILTKLLTVVLVSCTFLMIHSWHI